HAAAVVGVLGPDIAVLDLERDPRMAGAERPLPGAALPQRLDIGVGAGDGVELVAAQGSLHPECAADEVLVAATIVLGVVVVDAGGQGELAASQRALRDPAQSH